jgi:hypothetical protein
MTNASLSFIYGNGFDSLTRQLLHFTDLGGSRFVSQEETFSMPHNGSLPARDLFNPARIGSWRAVSRDGIQPADDHVLKRAASSERLVGAQMSIGDLNDLHGAFSLHRLLRLRQSDPALS